jgi:hypothetical protein
MTESRLRFAFVASSFALLAGLSAWSCGGSVSKRVPTPPGEAGAAGEPDGGAASGGKGGQGAAGGGISGAGGGPSEGGEAGTLGSFAGAAGEGGSAGAGEGGEGGAPPVIDVGVGCIAPGKETPLSPTAAGLPSSGLVLWLRGDRGVYATDTQRVCAWADQSGHGHLLLNNGAVRPLWGAAAIAQKPAISFDVNSSLAVGNVLDIPATSARTLIAVVQLISTTARFSAVMQGQAATPGTYVNLDANTFQTAGSREGVYVQNNAYDAALATSTAARVHVFTIGTMTLATEVLPAIEYRVNDAVQTLTRIQAGLGNGNFESFTGANFTLVGNGGPATIAEALIYDRVLAVEERTAVATALKARYAIQ